CPVMLRKDCVQAIAGLDADLPTIVLGARDASGRDVIPSAVYLDQERVTALDGRAITADPGPHAIRFEHPPDAPVVERVVLRAGEHNRPILATFASRAPPAVVEKTLPLPAQPPTPRARGPSGWVWIAGGVGVLGVGAFATLGIAGYLQKQQLLS